MKRIIFVYTISFFVYFLGLSDVQAKDELFHLENDYVSLSFNQKTFGLTSMVDKKTGVEHIYNEDKDALLWKLDYKMGAMSTEISNKVAKPTFKLEVLPDGSQLLLLTWNNILWWREDNFTTVKVKIQLPKDSGIAKWRINVDNHSDLWGLWKVKFPYVKGFLKSGKYDVAFPCGNGGENFKKLSDTHTRRYPSGGWPAQFLCGTSEGNSFYMSALDPDSKVKEFHISPGHDFYLTLYPEGMGVAGSDSPDNFSYAFGVYQGNWEKACKRYREWALSQRWTALGPLSQRDDVPGILKNIGIWLRTTNSEKDHLKLNYTIDDTQNLVRKVEDASAQLDVPIGVHWYNWHHMAFDNEYPYYFPGKPGMKEAFKGLVNKGHLIMPYINGMIADYGNADITSFLPYSTKDEYGVPRMHLWGKHSGRMVIMCPSQKIWQDKIFAVVDTLHREYGVNGVYIDQISAHGPELCFDKSHNHSIGGGKYWIDGFRDMLTQIRKYSVPRGVVITSEDTAEPYMDKMDAFLTWKNPSENQIPMLEMVYSGYTIYFGSRVEEATDLDDELFNAIEANSFLWGHQNGWMPAWYLQKGHEKKAAFIKRIGEYRVATRHFLTYGELMGLIKPTNDVTIVKKYYKDNKGRKHNYSYSEVTSSVWKSEDDKIGVYIANSSENENEFQFDLNLKEYSSALKYKVYQLEENGKRTFIKSITSPIHAFSENMKPFEIKVLELVPLK